MLLYREVTMIVGIVGAGTMGTDIAHLSIEHNYHVIVHDTDETQLKLAYEIITKRLDRYIAEKRLEQAKRGEIISRLKLHNNIKDMRNADIIIECVPEDVALKRDVFKALDAVCKSGAILASNTSSLSVTTIASATKRPEYVVGIHFMNPVPVMRLVEVVRAIETSEHTVQLALELVRRAGKTAVVCKDFPGFIVNRCARPYYGEALAMLSQGRSAAEIDAAMTAAGYRLGPFALIDLIGADIKRIKAAVLHSAVGELAFGDPLWVGVGEIHLRLEGLGESGGGDDDDVRLARFYADHQRIPGEWRDALDGRLWSRVHCSSMPPSARR